MLKHKNNFIFKYINVVFFKLVNNVEKVCFIIYKLFILWAWRKFKINLKLNKTAIVLMYYSSNLDNISQKWGKVWFIKCKYNKSDVKRRK